MVANTCIFEYCNLKNGYLKIRFTADNREMVIPLDDYSINSGMVVEINKLSERIKTEMINIGLNSIPKIELRLRCNEIYRTVFTVPVKNYINAYYLYKKEIKNKVNKEIYKTVFNSYRYGIGYIFNTYYIPINIVDSFNKIAREIGTMINSVKPFGMYLFDSLQYKENYVYFYIINKTCTMILSFDKNLITSYDFEFDDEKNLLTKFLLVASKHEFEFERKPITHFGIVSDEPINIDFGLNKFPE